MISEFIKINLDDDKIPYFFFFFSMIKSLDLEKLYIKLFLITVAN